ncbi:MAG: tetratricopeptide repeat protein [Acidobacteria bacterium]|nr:tetratricopeptide repeat protein [Acidobacteriota bacterium]
MIISEMPEKESKIFCQRCLAANSFEQELCVRCGTRLMLVVEPSSLRFEEDTAGGGIYEEHLLERVSALENKLMRLAEKLEHGLELLLRQSRTSYFDHALLDTLISLLGETGKVNPSKLEKLWRERCDSDASGIEAQEQRETLCVRVLKRYEGLERELFERLVREGFARLDEGKAAQGVRTLERAAALAPDNAPLNEFLGEHFFQAGKPALARDYLSRSLVSNPDDGRVRLLLGLACGDEGDALRAKELLVESVRLEGSSFAAHYGLGRLSAAEDDWKSALNEFKQALAARECPEAHYVVALVYYHLERYPTAVRHLAKAVKMDAEYAEAFYLLGVVYLRLGERVRAGESFDAARAADGQEPLYRNARRKMSRASEVLPPALFNVTGRNKRRLVTGGDDRLAAALQRNALRRVASR